MQGIYRRVGLEEWEQRESEVVVVVVEGGSKAMQGFAAQKEGLGQLTVSEGH